MVTVVLLDAEAMFCGLADGHEFGHKGIVVMS